MQVFAGARSVHDLILGSEIGLRIGVLLLDRPRKPPADSWPTVRQSFPARILEKQGSID